MIKSHFNRVDRWDFSCTMCRFCSTFVVYVYAFILKIFGFIAKSGNRSKIDRISSGVAEKESLEVDFGFKSMKSEYFDGNNLETEDSVFSKSGLVTETSKYQFMHSKHVFRFVEEANFSVQEMFVGSNEDSSGSDQILDCEIASKNGVLELNFTENSQEFDDDSDQILDCEISSKNGVLEHNSTQKSQEFDIGSDQILDSEFFSKKGVLEHNRTEKSLEFDDESLESSEKGLEEEEKSASLDGENHVPGGEVDENMEDHDFCYEIELVPNCQFSNPDENQESIFTGFKFLMSPQIFDHNLTEPENRKDQSFFATDSSEKFDDLDKDEYIELQPLSVNLPHINKESSSKMDELHEPEVSVISSHEEKSAWDLDYDSDNENENEPDVFLQHQNLVHQMKMELKNSRINGLPTISEDCETPKMAQDLKPLKIDQKIEYKDLMDEIQKFYRRYAEKMRKLDILNFQTLQAISFLQLKDSELFTSAKKKPTSMLKTFTLPKIWPCKVHRIYADPTLRSIVELNRDLESVYVGQLCLSWEILNWQYVKTKELLEHDSQMNNHSYNRVVEEFQQFQVLLQRFMEDEPFHGHRVQNYVKNRCVIRSLLQVPLVKGDCSEDKKQRLDEKDSISLEILLQIIGETMQIFQEFIRADKGSKDVIFKNIIERDTENSVLIVDIIEKLQKKDRKLKENIRSKNCIVKKLQKHQERRPNREAFCSEVELRLISRVLNLSKLTTNQLVWCQNKLDNINFVNRKVHVETSFLLFPC